MEDSTWEGAIQSAEGGAATSEAAPPQEPTEAPAPEVPAATDAVDDTATESREADTTTTTDEAIVQTPDRSDEEEEPPAKSAPDPARSVRIMDEYLDPSAPIGTVTERLYNKSPARFAALARDILTTYKDHFVEEVFGVSESEIRAKLEARPVTKETAPAADDQSVDYDPLTDPLLDESVKARLRNEEQLRAKLARFDDLEKKVTTAEEAERQRAADRHTEQAQAIQRELVSSVTKVIDEEIEGYGLAVLENDPPQIKHLKKTAERLLRADFPAAFDSVAENTKAAERAMAHANNLERDNAFREEDRLKVATRSTMRALKAREDVKAIFETIEELSRTRAARINGRGKSAPPIPGSTGSGAPLTPQQAQGATIGQMWDQMEGEVRQSR